VEQIAQLNALYENGIRSHEFAAYAQVLLEAKGFPGAALEIAKQNRAAPRVLSIFKSAISVGSTNDPSWAGDLSDHSALAQGFLASLAPFSAFDRALTDGSFLRVPLRTRVSIVTTGASGAVVGEGEPKPLSKVKVVTVVAVTNDLVRSVAPGALSLIESEMRRAVAVKSDEAFLDILTQTTGVASVPSSGMGAAQFAADLADALDAISYGADARLYLVLPPATAKVVAFLRDANGTLYPGMTVSGGTIAGIKVVVSNAATDAVLFDASQIAANSDTITIDASTQASLQLNDNPSSGPQGLVFLWQNNMQAMRATRYFGAEVLRESAIAVITGVTA
jgi:hypothetical protein